jgi:cysteine desulfuration protein SufE
VSTFEERLSTTIEKYAQYESWEDRYKHLIQQGKSLEAMPDDQKNEDNLIKGCQSQVWLIAELKDDGKIYFKGDSDASIVRGIVGLLLFLFNGSQPVEILSLKSNFLDPIGLRQHLSMSRANGLANMIKQIQFYAMAFKAKQQMNQ